MQRVDIIQKIGKKYFFPNIENDEFSYKKVLEKVKFNHYKLDLRFEKNNLSVLVETKKNNKFYFSDKDINQLMTYARLEREYRKDNHVVSILYNLENDECRVYYDDKLSDDENLNCMEFYEDKFQKNKINDRNKVLKATAKLNEKLHSFGVKEKLRSQLVGSFLISLNNGLKYHDLETSEILGRIRRILDDKIDNDNCDDQKKIKIKTIIKIFDHEDIKGISSKNLVNLLDLVNEEIIPNIDDRNPHGEDLLNLFFTTFNKYAYKEKNQTFTPPHITDFMCEIVQLNPNSRVLDPTCGSGSFLVQAMYKMLKQVKNDNNKKRSFIKKSQLFGIESSQGPFGLAVTNMLIHRDGKSNIINKSCFDEQLKGWIKNKNIDVVLMNPPFNANIQNLDDKCPKIKKTNMDATKGLYFVYYIADIVQKGYLATILPLPCAIGNGNHIFMYKKKY